MLRIDVSIDGNQGGYGYGNLRVSESISLPMKDFLSLCAVLAEFHKLAESFKIEEPEAAT